jgi:hypothetical protein
MGYLNISAMDTPFFAFPRDFSRVRGFYGRPEEPEGFVASKLAGPRRRSQIGLYH